MKTLSILLAVAVVAGTCLAGGPPRDPPPPSLDDAKVADIRDKEGVQTIEYGLKEILELHPVSFRLPTDRTILHLGLLAQEVELLIPEIVVADEEDPEGPKKLRYEELIPVLIKAMQEQQKQIEKLKAQVAELEKK